MTLAQMTLFLREGETLQRRNAAREAQLTRTTVWADEEVFGEMISRLEH